MLGSPTLAIPVQQKRLEANWIIVPSQDNRFSINLKDTVLLLADEGKKVRAKRVQTFHLASKEFSPETDSIPQSVEALTLRGGTNNLRLTFWTDVEPRNTGISIRLVFQETTNRFEATWTFRK